jgi:hypothetical protein
MDPEFEYTKSPPGVSAYRDTETETESHRDTDMHTEQ